MTGARMIRRFWTGSEVVEADAGFTVRLDGREIRSPGRALLVLPTRAYAEAMRAEWDAQDDRVRPETMPLTRSANSAIDVAGPEKARIIEMLADYAESDLLCYRAEEPEELSARQAGAWDPLIAWAEATLGVRFRTTAGVMPVAQDDAARQAVKRRLEAEGPFGLVALHDLIQITGSAILGLAVREGRLGADAAWRLSRLDEDWQSAQWGEAAEAAEAARRRRTDLLHAARVLDLVAGEVAPG